MSKTYIVDGIEYEVVFDGTQSLIGDRDSRPLFDPAPQKRLYQKSGKYKKVKAITEENTEDVNDDSDDDLITWRRSHNGDGE
jgi:hypothetical protein